MRLRAVIGGVVSLIVAYLFVGWLFTRASTPTAAPKPLDPSVDLFETNPFEKPRVGPFPKIEIAETLYDFGVTKVGLPNSEVPSGTHGFVVKNVGEAPLKLAKGPTQCKCALAKLNNLELAPGESTTITLEWKPLTPEEAFYKEATIWTNDPALWEGDVGQGKLMLKIKGMAVPGMEVEPPFFQLGTLTDEGKTIEANAFSRVLPDLKVEIESTSSPFVTAEVSPMTPEDTQALEALVAWKIVGKIDPRVGIGTLNETITLKTNDDTSPRVPIEINAFRQGPISIAGPFFLPTHTLVDFRQFDAAKGISTTLHLYGAKGPEPLKLELVSKKPEELEVEAVADTMFPEPDREHQMITIRVPAGLPPTRYDSSDAGGVKFRTNHPDVGKLDIHVFYESR